MVQSPDASMSIRASGCCSSIHHVRPSWGTLTPSLEEVNHAYPANWIAVSRGRQRVFLCKSWSWQGWLGELWQVG